MRCSRCGAQIGNSYVRFNGVLLCEDCARELKVDEVFRRQNSLFDQAFPMLGDFPGVFSSGSDLDFANAKIRCPRCGTTLRELESGGQLGCIECYNTFNESILKDILKRQGSSEYMGRKPGEAANIKVSAKAEAAPSDDKQETAEAAPSKEEAKQPEEEEISPEEGGDAQEEPAEESREEPSEEGKEPEEPAEDDVVDGTYTKAPESGKKSSFFRSL